MVKFTARHILEHPDDKTCIDEKVGEEEDTVLQKHSFLLYLHDVLLLHQIFVVIYLQLVPYIESWHNYMIDEGMEYYHCSYYLLDRMGIPLVWASQHLEEVAIEDHVCTHNKHIRHMKHSKLRYQ